MIRGARSKATAAPPLPRAGGGALLSAALIAALVAGPARAQEGGLGITTERPPAREGGAGEASDAEEDGGEGGLGVDTGDDEGGLGVDTGASDAGTAASGDEGAADDAEAAGAEDEGEHDREGGPGDEGDEEGALDDAAADDAALDDAALDDAALEDDLDEDLDDEPVSRARWSDERLAAWATFGGGFAVSVTGAILLAAGADDVNTIENAPGGTDWDRVVDAYERAPILTAAGAVVLGVGVAGMAAGAILLAVFGEEGTWVEATLGPTGVGVRGRF